MRTPIVKFLVILAALTGTAAFANVNPDGSFSHTLPIELPAGRNGLQPQLALAYNSNAGNGIVGIGWSLQGLPAITRMNYGNGINYGKAGYPADTFAGPEGRLIDLGAGIYHAETETWSKYEPSGNCGNGPCSWIVTDRNGLKYYYGLTSNSRIVAKDSNNNEINNGAVRVWALERVEDLNGNYYEVSYKKDAGLFYDHGQYYPEKINYTLGGGAGKHYAVSFFFDETGRPDKEINYSQSAYVKTSWRLSKIAVDYQTSCFLVFTCADRVHSFELEYGSVSVAGQSQMTKWQGYDAANLGMPAIQFSWTTGGVGYGGNQSQTNLNMMYNGVVAGADQLSAFADLNGDGLIDLVRWDSVGNAYWNFNSGNGFGPNKSQSNLNAMLNGYSNGSYQLSSISDLNGDGKPDLVRWDSSGNAYWNLGNGNGFESSQSQTNLNTMLSGVVNGSHQLSALVDFNGDGKLDLARWDSSGNVYWNLWTGNGFGANQSASNLNLMYNGTFSGAEQLSAFIDLDGDGKIDLIRWDSMGNVYWNSGTGTGFGPNQSQNNLNIMLNGYQNGSYQLSAFTDLNADGQIDLIRWDSSGNVHWNYGTGGGFAATQTQSNVNLMLTGLVNGSYQKSAFLDLNHDGKIDLIRWDSSGNAYWNPGTHNGFGPNQAQGNRNLMFDGFVNGSHQLSAFADINGDGQADLVRWDSSGNLYSNISTTATPNLISRITHPGGSFQDIAYSSAVQLTNAICPVPASCNQPDGALVGASAQPNPSLRYLVTQVTTTSNMDLDGNGQPDSFTTEYSYYNGRMTNGTVAERASLGFEKIKTRDANTGSYTIDTYRQDKPFHGRLAKSASYLADGSKVSETTHAALAQYYCDETGCNTYKGSWVDGNPDAVPQQPQQLRAKLAEQVGANEPSLTTELAFENGIAIFGKSEGAIAYDSYGNATNVISSGGGNGIGKSSYRHLQYINEPASGPGQARTIGLVYNEKTCLTSAACSANDANFVAESNVYFDGQATTGVIGSRKLLTKKESYLSTGAATGVWVPETFSYDALGNVTQKVDAQGITTTIAYDSDYRQYPVSVTKSHGGSSSVVSFEYDYRFGKKTLETNHDDGNVTLYTMNASGFVTGQQTQNGATILAKAAFAHSPLGTAPIWTQECTYYGATFTTAACRKKFVDALGRVYREEFPDVNAGIEVQMASERRYVQNGSGRKEYASLAKSTSFDFAGSFAVLAFPGDWSENSFDQRGRAVATRTHDNRTTSVAYRNAGVGPMPAGSVQCTVTTDFAGVKKRTCTDVNGKTNLVTEAKDGTQMTDVAYVYDSLGRLISVVAPQGVTLVGYVGRSPLQQSITDPVAGTTSYEYYLTPGQADFMKLHRETRPGATDAIIAELEYAAAFGRTSKKTNGFAATPVNDRETTVYTYDETAVTFGKGRLTTLAFTTEGYTLQDRYSYNNRGETTQTTRRISHASETLCADANAMPCLQTFGSAKDELGRIKTMTYPDGKVTTINYLPGSTKNVASIVHDGTTYATYSNYTYDVAPHVGKVTYGNGVEHDYVYNSATGLMNTVTIGKPGNDPLMSLAYTCNLMMNIERIDDAVIPTLTTAYQYDSLNRLTQATWDPDAVGVSTVRTYAFDNQTTSASKGNLERKGNRRLTYAAGKTYPVSDEIFNPSTLVWQPNATYTWSANGNLLTKGAFTFSYDSNNMLSRAVEVDPQNPANTVGDSQFLYDNTGQRFLKKHTRFGTTIKTWYLGDGIELREKYVGVAPATPNGTYDSSQNTRYVYGVDNKKLASITGSTYTAALSATSGSMLALADSYSSTSASGVAAKVYYNFYGAYAFVKSLAHDLNHGQARIIALVLLAFAVLLYLCLTPNPSPKGEGRSKTLSFRRGWSLRRPGEAAFSLWHRATSTRRMALVAGSHGWLKRATAMTMLFAFVTVNCGTQLPSGITPGQVDAALLDLYTGLPTGTAYYSHNHLGSGALVTDTAGNEIFRITYDEYGQIDLEKSGKFNPVSGLIEHHIADADILVTAVKYTGQEYDPETGLYYYNARYFDPQLGVFTTPDTIVDPGAGNFGLNRHMYGAGNPVRFTDPSGHNIFDDIGDWWDENVGNPIKEKIGDKAFNVLAGIGSGLVPGLDQYQAYKAGGIGNVLLGEVGKGTTGAMNMAGCIGCYANFSYTYDEGFGFGAGWGSAPNGAGVNLTMGIMYRERGLFAGLSSTVGLGIGVGAYGSIGLNIIAGTNGNVGLFGSFGARDGNAALGVSAGAVCTAAGCNSTFSGYSALDYGAMGIGDWRTGKKYMTGGTNTANEHREQTISYGQAGDSLTFGPDWDNSTWYGALFGERGALGILGQMAGGKPTSVMHDNLVVSRAALDRGWPGRVEFVATMPASYAIAQPLAHMSYRVNNGYRSFMRGF